MTFYHKIMNNFHTSKNHEIQQNLPIKYRVNSLGGYGANSEVIFERHPFNCPSSLTISHENATATFLTNGSVDFEIKHLSGLTVRVLEGSFDPIEKRETGVPSSNVWLEFSGRFASIINPNANWNLPPASIQVTKTSAPREMEFCASFYPTPDSVIESTATLTMIPTPHGHVLQRRIHFRNTGKTRIAGNLWTYFNLRGTQRFVYHKPLWYDMGLPLSATETVTAARMPNEDILQIKRISSQPENLTACESTCDYSTFIGDSSAFSIFPQSLQHGRLLDHGARERLNRFTTSSISASRFAFDLQPNESASLLQSLLYVEDESLIETFRQQITCEEPGYSALESAFRHAAQDLIKSTSSTTPYSLIPNSQSLIPNPPFEISLPTEPAISAYLNSLWSGVDELYEKCRAHGATLADGIEVGTRDRAQDMFLKMKADPARVRADLIHAFSFMYVTDDTPSNGRLTLPQKLHGQFPRQYPSRWLDRKTPVQNDNRPYADSPLWLIDALLMYLRETGDLSILQEQVETIHLLDPEHPEVSGIIGAEKRLLLVDVVKEIFASFHRHVTDSPYGLAQILFGDWCDPVDMFGTDKVGNPTRRAHGRGAQIRLSAHLFLCLVHAVDVFSAPNVRAILGAEYETHLNQWKHLADQIRKHILHFAWEGEGNGCFIDCIHELKKDGTPPNYASGELGYTLGSMNGRDFDGVPRSVLTTQAFCLEMLTIERDYLDEPADKNKLIHAMLQQVDETLFRPDLGLLLFSQPIPNTREAVSLVGRMGILPSGCAENGEYHHAQMFMHTFRLSIPHQVNTVWEQFKPMLSVGRDESIGGAFDMTSNSYASDEADPHFGAGMYFGLSGSVDWIIEFIQKISGLHFALHDDSQPDLRIEPILPDELQSQFVFKRIIHKRDADGYRQIPFTVRIEHTGEGNQLTADKIFINGKQAEDRLIRDVSEYEALDVHIIHFYERSS